MSAPAQNQSKAIASLVCPYLRAKSSKTPFRILAAEDDELFSGAYRLLQMSGVRKGFFQNRRNYVIESILHFEHNFAAAHPVIELMSDLEKIGHWTGSGEFKEASACESMLLAGKFEAMGITLPGPDALIQINITSIWSEIAPLLEKLDPAERDAERRRRQQAVIASIPIYQGPRDPKIEAENNALIAKLFAQKKADPPNLSNEDPF